MIINQTKRYTVYINTRLLFDMHINMGANMQSSISFGFLHVDVKGAISEIRYSIASLLTDTLIQEGSA